MEDSEAQKVNQTQPLLDMNALAQTQKKQARNAISQAFRSTAHLSNLLPTGSVLAFQLLSPIVANQGRCTVANKTMTACLLALCTFSCFILSFSDSFRDAMGNVRHGLATFGGFWVVDDDVEPSLPPEAARNYRIRFVDFIHGFMSVLVFMAVVLVDHNVVECFYPNPSEDVKQVVTALPVAIGALCSMIFVVFPTTRHGIGFPLSSN